MLSTCGAPAMGSLAFISLVLSVGRTSAFGWAGGASPVGTGLSPGASPDVCGSMGAAAGASACAVFSLMTSFESSALVAAVLTGSAGRCEDGCWTFVGWAFSEGFAGCAGWSWPSSPVSEEPQQFRKARNPPFFLGRCCEAAFACPEDAGLVFSSPVPCCADFLLVRLASLFLPVRLRIDRLPMLSAFSLGAFPPAAVAEPDLSSL